MLELAVNRKWLRDNSTVGRIFINGVDIYFSMERGANDPFRIPAGSYEIALHTPHSTPLRNTLASMVLKYPTMAGITQYPQLLGPGVSGRDPVLLHPGNKPTDSDGCILVGMGVAQDYSAILEAQYACSLLIPQIVAAVNGEGCSLTVSDPMMVRDESLGVE